MAKKTTAEEKKVTKALVKKAEKPVKKSVEEIKTQKAPATEAMGASEIADTDKQVIITEFALKTGDTGSPEVQIALATHKILNLAKHLELNPKDNHSRRGLLKIISKRRRILNYLSSKDEARYKELIKRLRLKK